MSLITLTNILYLLHMSARGDLNRAASHCRPLVFLIDLEFSRGLLRGIPMGHLERVGMG